MQNVNEYQSQRQTTMFDNVQLGKGNMQKYVNR